MTSLARHISSGETAFVARLLKELVCVGYRHSIILFKYSDVFEVAHKPSPFRMFIPPYRR